MLIYNKLVLGGTLEAAEFAFQNELPLIINKPKPPFFFEEEKTKNWNQKLFILGLAGLHPLASRASTIRIEDDNTLKAIIGPREQKIKFEELFIFDDENVEGLLPPKKKIKKHLVLDWMKPKSCSPHDLKRLTSDDDFVKEIIFYSSLCHSGKALVVKSFLTRQKLESYEYSDTYARFKAEKMLKNAGLIGKRNGIYHLLLEIEKREVKQYKMSQYQDTNTMKFIYNFSPDSAIIEQETNSYLNKLKSYFGKRITE